MPETKSNCISSSNSSSTNSVSNTKDSIIPNVEQNTTEKDIELDDSWYPNSAPELKQLVTFYRLQSLIFMKERTKYEQHMNKLSMSFETKHKLEWTLHSKNQEIIELHQQLSDTHVLLYNEKTMNLSQKSIIKQLTADIHQTQQENQHMLSLINHQSSSSMIKCKNHSQKKKIKNNFFRKKTKIQKVEHQPQMLTTVYLPNDNSKALQLKLNAIIDEMCDFRKQCSEIHAFLMHEKQKADRMLTEHCTEYDSKFVKMNEEMNDISTMHMFNLKEYLKYRRESIDQVQECKLEKIKEKQKRMVMGKKCEERVKNTTEKCKRKSKRLATENSKMMNEFRKQVMIGDEDRKHLKEKLHHLNMDYNSHLCSLETELLQNKRIYQKLRIRRQLEKEGVFTDIRDLKNKVLKMSNKILFVDDKQQYCALSNEIRKVQNSLEKLAKQVM